MDGKRTTLLAGLGCALLILAIIVAVPAGLLAAGVINRGTIANQAATIVSDVGSDTVVPTSLSPVEQTEAQPALQATSPQQLPGVPSESLTALYQQANAGVVNVEVQINRGFASGQGAGSGFILDNEGHIVTNNHVVAGATRVTVVFYNGIEAEAEVVGTDDDSDLAVLKVDQLVEGAHPLPLADSDAVQAGEWVVAIGNPFQYGGSMTVGIVSAVGRTIPSGATLYAIPQAIQTDAAINPGNSGGPLLNLKGEVIGVNAQIRSDGVAANAGVGFAIPSNVVQLVAPSLIKNGTYVWPWLGVRGTGLDLTLMQANDLSTQQGAYLTEVTPRSPAADAGLQGSSRTAIVDGLQVPVGGDVVVEVDGKPIANFDELLVEVAFKQPGDKLQLTVLRDGQRQQTTVTLAARPATGS